MLNSPKKTPKPGSDVMQQAMQLLSAIGSPDNPSKKILEELEQACSINDVAYEKAVKANKEASDKIQECEQSCKQLDEKTKIFREECREREGKLNEREAELLKLKHLTNEYVENSKKDWNEKHLKLKEWGDSLVIKDKELSQKQDQYNKELANLRKLTDSANKKLANLTDIKQKLREIVNKEEE